jgi:glycosyltransferase involved in cell wall biosynthesis
MSEKPLISIITVNLNDVEGLIRTMTSVFGQTFKEFEYIVIDGGSTDGSKEYIESHSDKIDCWVSEKDSGIYNAMNKGIKKSTGEYLLFLNSGDWLFENKVLENVAYKLAGCDVLYGNMVKVFPDGKQLLDKGVNGNEITFKTFAEGTLNHSSSLIKRNLFIKYGFYDENLKIVSDWKFFLITLGLNKSEVRYLDSTISCFDMTGISNANIELRNSERLKVLREEIPFPIYTDYLKLRNLETTLNSHRIRKFIETDNNKIPRKLHSLIFRIFS